MSITAVKRRVQQFLAELEAAQAEACARQRDLLARHRDEMALVQREIDIATGKVDALKWSLSQIDSVGEAGATDTLEAKPRRRGRSLSGEWNGWLSHLPVTPAPGMDVGPFIDIVHRDRPDMPRANIRSQLSNLKSKGWLELEGTGWRLTKPLAALTGAAPENEDANSASSDDEAPPAEPSRASSANSPLLSFQARAAA